MEGKREEAKINFEYGIHYCDDPNTIAVPLHRLGRSSARRSRQSVDQSLTWESEVERDQFKSIISSFNHNVKGIIFLYQSKFSMARDHFEVSQKSINLIGLDRQDSAFPGKKNRAILHKHYSHIPLDPMTPVRNIRAKIPHFFLN
jgi:hypothetical protein